MLLLKQAQLPFLFSTHHFPLGAHQRDLRGDLAPVPKRLPNRVMGDNQNSVVLRTALRRALFARGCLYVSFRTPRTPPFSRPLHFYAQN